MGARHLLFPHSGARSMAVFICESYFWHQGTQVVVAPSSSSLTQFHSPSSDSFQRVTCINGRQKVSL